MPGRLKYYRNDPNGKGRGRGLYYHRGHRIFSKYSLERDRNKLSDEHHINAIGLPKESKLLHVSDGNLRRKKRW